MLKLLQILLILNYCKGKIDFDDFVIHIFDKVLIFNLLQVTIISYHELDEAIKCSQGRNTIIKHHPFIKSQGGKLKLTKSYLVNF